MKVENNTFDGRKEKAKELLKNLGLKEMDRVSLKFESKTKDYGPISSLFIEVSQNYYINTILGHFVSRGHYHFNENNESIYERIIPLEMLVRKDETLCLSTLKENDRIKFHAYLGKIMISPYLSNNGKIINLKYKNLDEQLRKRGL